MSTDALGTRERGSDAPGVGARQRDSEAPVATLAAQIVQAAVRPDISIGELAQIAEGDPAFTVRVLSMVNSPAYGLGRRVSDLRHAAGLLGIRGLRNIALSLSLSDMAPLGEGGDALLGISLRRAAVARLLAEASRQQHPEEFFTAGLLLELGILCRARSDLDRAADVARAPAVTRIMRERAAGDVPHPARGAEMARVWQLSEEVVAAIEHHHEAKPPAELIARVGWVAERVAALFEGGDYASTRNEALAAMALLGLKGAPAEKLLQDIPGRVEEAAQAFQRNVGPQPNLDTLVMDANASLVELNRNYGDLVRTLEQLVAEKESLTKSLQEANERLEKLAATDGLTGLYNRRAFMDAMKRDLARADRAKTVVSLVMMDIDHFKKVNDTHGHQTGDEVLRGFSSIIRASVREGDVPGRYGGEEFALLLPATNAAQAVVVAERVRVAMERTPFTVATGTFRVTASFGIATVSGPGCAGAGETLIHRADQALYKAKHEGRNRVVVAQ